jgi:hypothetical protein
MKAEKYSLTMTLQKSEESFRYFLENIYPLSFHKGVYKSVKHTLNWADLMQNNRKMALLSARKHLKSSTLYAYVMWRLLHTKKDYEILYLSYKSDMAQYHTKNIKNLILKNPFFEDVKDLTQAESILKFQSLKGYKFVVEPEGIMSFKRGRHPDEVLNDDILADPTNELNLLVIDKISRTFFEDVMSLPKEGGRIYLFGTPQHQEDLFFKLKNNEGWIWSENKAIINEANKEVLWIEMFPFERLLEIRDKEIGEKAFNKEYMCSPVYSEEAFFRREELLNIVNVKLENKIKLPEFSYGLLISGLDIGKHAHPSHFVIFAKDRENRYIMLYEKFFDNMEYIVQAKFINEIINNLKVSKVYFDNTRGEFEGFLEEGIIVKNIWMPVRFSTQEKFTMAANFEKIVKDKRIELINDERMIKSIASVNNDLEALETPEGHGDAFWSIALALSYEIENKFMFQFVTIK